MLRRFFHRLMPKRLDAYLALVFGVVVLAGFALMLFVVNRQATLVIDKASITLFTHIVNESSQQIEKDISAAGVSAQIMSLSPYAQRPNTGDQTQYLKELKTLLSTSPVVTAIFVTYDDGGTMIFRSLNADAVRQRIHAPANAQYLYGLTPPAGSMGPRQESLTFLDGDLKRIGNPVTITPVVADMRQRPWYQSSLKQNHPFVSGPYEFTLTGDRGVTLTQRLASDTGTVGVDISFVDMSRRLQDMHAFPSAQMVVVNQDGAVLASSHSAPGDVDINFSNGQNALTHAMVGVALSAKADDPAQQILPVENRDWAIRAVRGETQQWPFYVVQATPEREIFASLHSLITVLGWLSVIIVAMIILATYQVARAISRPLQAIAREAAQLRSFDFATVNPLIRSNITEIDILAKAIRRAHHTIQRFIKIGNNFLVEHDPFALTSGLLQETVHLTGAKGGMIFLTNDGGTSFSTIHHQSAKSLDYTLSPASIGLAERIYKALHRKHTTHLSVTPNSRNEPLVSLLRGLSARYQPESDRLSVIPLLDRSHEVIGGLLLVNDWDHQSNEAYHHLQFVQAISGNAAVALETTLLLESRKSLLNAVIRMMAEAIDAKSPYTGSHCQHIPELTSALVREACAQRSGPFANFMLNADQWEAVEVASWLHDCGKLTIPDHIMDKATKLEALTNRIHEVRTRFEVLKANAHVDYWRGVAQGGDEATLREERDATLQTLDDDFAFIASCNVGSERLSSEAIARIKRIAQRRWVRTMDDTLGISEAEQLRRKRLPKNELPAEEFLLADRPDQLIEHSNSNLSVLESQGHFNLVRPEYQANLGEIYNLSIARGTLTAEDRYAVQQHITRTIVMLEGLPWTGALKAVPEYAGSHHERMDGTGYPRGLQREEMSVVARVMAVADVFEALTSTDRPYKKPKTLSEVFRIMGEMKRTNHLDPDLLDLFLTSDIWRAYADAYLQPEQLDTPDIAAVLAIRPEAMPAPELHKAT